jgi:hypothetical protein
MKWLALWQCNETKTLQEYEAACLPVACAFVCIQTKTLQEYEAVCAYLAPVICCISHINNFNKHVALIYCYSNFLIMFSKSEKVNMINI